MNFHKPMFFIWALCLILSCSKDETAADTPFVPSQNALAWKAGYNTFDQEMGGHLRNFVIHVPTKYDATKAVSLVFMLHGSSGDGDRFYNISGWTEKADQEGFIVVFPTGREYPIAENNGKLGTKWSSDGLINDIVPGTEIVDDVVFMRALVDKCKETFFIDAKRVYISGFSNGGAFVRSRVMTEMNDVFAAGSTGGGFGLPAKKTVKGNVFMPLYSIVGTKDNKIIDASGTNEDVPFEADVLMSEAIFRKQIDGVLQTLNLGNEYTEERVTPKYNIITFENDLSKQGNEHILMVVNALDHNYPTTKNNKHEVNAVDHFWPWFQKFSLK